MVTYNKRKLLVIKGENRSLARFLAPIVNWTEGFDCWKIGTDNHAEGCQHRPDQRQSTSVGVRLVPIHLNQNENKKENENENEEQKIITKIEKQTEQPSTINRH